MKKTAEIKWRILCASFMIKDQAIILWRGLFFRLAVLLPSLSLLIFMVSFSAYAQEHETSALVLNKVQKGEISATSPSGFALLYKEEGAVEYEMWFPFTETTQYIGGYSGPEDLSLRDKVMISYEETGDKKNRTLRSVNLMRKGEPLAIKPPEVEPAPASA